MDGARLRASTGEPGVRLVAGTGIVVAPQLTCQVGTSREFPKLWGASAASNLGDGIWLVAAPLLAASLTDNPTHVAGATFAQRLPWLIFPLVSGTLADRFDR